MPTHDAQNYYFSGQGVVMIGLRDATTGNPVGLRPVGNVPDMKIAVSTAVLDHKGSQDGQRATDKRLQTETKVMATVTLESWIAKNLAKALRGAETLIPGGSVVGEAVNAYPGLVSAFDKIKVSAVVVRQDATTLTAYTDGTTPWDYKLNTEAGSIMLNDPAVTGVAYAGYVASSPPELGDGLTVDYTYAEQYLVDALTAPLTDNWLRFEGLNTVETNEPVIVDIFRFSNDPLKELALLSDTFGQFVLEGVVLKDDTRLTGSKYFNIKKLSNVADV